MKYQNILHIDDDDDDCLLFADVVQNMPEPRNYIKASDPATALRKLKNLEIKPDIIFTDYHMPMMNAMEFLLQLKSIECIKDVPVIVLSTTAEDAIVEKTLGLGAKAYYTKPGNYSELIEIIRSNV